MSACVPSANLRRHSGDDPANVRGHRSASPLSAGFTGRGVRGEPGGVKRRSRCRYAFACRWAPGRANTWVKWSPNQHAQTYQSEASRSSAGAASG